MLWIGATEELEENADRAILRGHLGKDWAVAMPPWNVRFQQNGSDRAKFCFFYTWDYRCYQQRELNC